MVKAFHRARRRGIFRLVGCVICSKVWVGLNNIVIIREHKQLGSPRIIICLQYWRNTGCFDLLVVCFEFSPGLGYANTDLLIDLLIVEDTARSGKTYWHSEDPTILGHSRFK